MDMDRVRIADVITTEYSDFLSFCSASIIPWQGWRSYSSSTRS